MAAMNARSITPAAAPSIFENGSLATTRSYLLDALLAAPDLVIERQHVVVEVDLHRVALRLHVARKHEAAGFLDPAVHLGQCRQGIFAADLRRDPFSLRLRERHGRAKRLEEPDERESRMRGVED